MAQPTEPDALRELLARRVDEIAAEAVRTDGEVAETRLEAAARLARLVELRGATAAQRRRRRVIPLASIITLVLASVLLFVHVPRTHVELHVTVSEVGFVVPTYQVFSDAMSVRAVGVSGVTAVELPGLRRREAADVLLTASRASSGPGSVDLDPITLPGRSRVSLRRLDDPGRYEVILSGVAELAGTANGAVEIVVPPNLNAPLRFASPQHITFTTDTAEVRLDLTLAGRDGQAEPLRVPLSVERLRLYRIDRFEGPEQTVVREVSTVRSGKIYFESINGEERMVRSGEELRFDAASGEVSEWRLDSAGIGLRFRGTVRGMRTGVGPAQRSLMPTMLEWLRARHGLGLLWATTAYVVGVFVTVRGWWKRQP